MNSRLLPTIVYTVILLTAQTWAGVIEVDNQNPAAADANAGTVDKPLKTIAEAARRAVAARQAGQSSEIIVQPGIYRENVQLFDSPRDTAATITLSGMGDRVVTISGSDVLDGWQNDDRADVYRHAWTYKFGQAPLPEGFEPVAKDLTDNPIVMRSEMVFVAGAMARQVMTIDELRSRANAFFVDEAANTIWLHTSPGIDPAKATIEAAVRPSLLETANINGLTLRHLTFTHAACHLQNPGVQISNEGNVTIEDCAFNWNNWTGLGLAESHDVTLKNITADHNGGSGFGGWRVNNLTGDTLEASYNNWRGDWGNFHSWCVGQKFMSLHGGKFTNYVAHDNLAPALWFDTDNIDITVDHAVLDNNYNQGLFLEASPGPETFRECTITRNGETGILATNTANVTIDHCTITGNRLRQVFVPWQATAHSVMSGVINYQTRQAAEMRSDHWTLTNNIIAGQGPQQLMVISKWPWFLSTLKLSGNAWHQADRDDVFAIFNASLTEPVKTDFAGWCNWTGEGAPSSIDHNPLPVEPRKTP